MNKIVYKMSKEMYDTIRFPLVWSSKMKKMVKKGTPLTKKEVLEKINTTYGLRGTVVEVNII